MKKDNNNELSLDQLDSVVGGKKRAVYYEYPACPDCGKGNISKTGNTRPRAGTLDDYECVCMTCRRKFWQTVDGATIY